MNTHTFESPLVGDPATLRAVRQAIEAEVDRLIDMLDQFDGDADFEPSFGYVVPGGAFDALEPDPDLEDDGTAEEDDPDEPTLGAPERHPRGYGWDRDRTGDQTHWADGDDGCFAIECEAEDEHGGDIQDEPHDELEEGNREPSLGSLEFTATQLGWANSDMRDLEFDPAESGIADFGGLIEQGWCREVAI